MPSTNVIHIEGQTLWTVFPNRDRTRWIAVCDAVGLTVEGRSQSELAESIAESLDLVLQDVFERDEFEAFLLQHGWRQATPIPPRSRRRLRFEVPFYTVPRPSHDREAAVY